MKIKNKIRQFFETYSFDGALFKNFIKIFIVVMMIFSAVIIFLHKYISKTSADELYNFNKSYIANIANVYDVILDEVKYVACNMAIDSDALMYTVQNSDNIQTEDMIKRLKEKIKAYETSLKYIDSMYIYSQDYNKVCSSDGNFEFDKFSDKAWQERFLHTQKGKLSIFARRLNSGYPKVVTVIVRMQSDDYNSGVIVNIDLDRLGGIGNVDNETNMTDTYIIDGSKCIIYSPNKKDFGKTYYGIIREVIDGKKDVLEDETGIYVGGSQKSEKSDWTYVGVTRFDGYSEKMQGVNRIMILIIIITILAGVFIAFLLALTTYKPVAYIRRIVEANEYSAEDIKESDIREIASRIMRIINENDNLRQELQKTLGMYDNLQIMTLQAQINPHFLNNTLKMIYVESLKTEKNDSSDMIMKLSRIMRYSYITNNYIVTVGEEIEFLKLYADMLYKRYKNFEVIWDIDEHTVCAKIARLCLQPIIENAISYGVSGIHNNGIITVRSYNDDKYLYIDVEDNGVGMSEETLNRLKSELNNYDVHSKGLGLKNVAQRLKLMFNEEAILLIESSEGLGTKVTVRLPWINENII